MIPDPTDEIREIKRKLSEKFGNDVHRIAEDARRRQSESGRQSVMVPSAIGTALNSTSKAMRRNIGDGAF